MDLSFLPHLNAALNALASVLLVAGFVMIKKRRATAHRNCMLAATIVSCLFLISYVTHHLWRSTPHTPYQGPHWLRTPYYAMLLTHIVLAMIVPVIALRLIFLGFTARFERHRRLAGWGLPIWLYVSVTGVLIYLTLYWLPEKT